MKKIKIAIFILIGYSTTQAQNTPPLPSGDVKIDNADLIIDNIDGKGVLLYQEDSHRFGKFSLQKGSGTGDGTPNTLLIEAGNTYGTQFGQRILFKTASNDRFVIEHDGNVGLGTITPSEKLTIENGNIKIDNVDGRGVKLYQEDSHRFGQFILQKGSGTGDGTPNTLLIEAGNTYGTQFGQRILFKTASTDRFVIEHDGKVGIGTTAPDAGALLTVAGSIHSKEIKVLANAGVPDYVFEEDYELRTLQETKEYIQENKHLPEIPSAKEIDENDGFNVGEMNMMLLKKIEELTLYQIELLERIEKIEKKVE